MKQSLKSFQQTGIIAILILILTSVMAACTNGSVNTNSISPGNSNNALKVANIANNTKYTTVADNTSNTSIILGTRPCPTAIGDPTHWDAIIPIKANISKVESVSCANLIGKNTLQALIKERISGTGSFLNIYVYDNITAATPTQLFKLQGLEHADAKISNYNTILTGEVDAQSSINKNVGSNAGLMRDLYREFRWSDGAGTFVPTAFPGIFPDLTRYQAEDDQQQVNQGKQPWKLDAAMSANALAVTMLQWPATAPTTLVSGGGQHDATAVVAVKSPNPGGGGIQVTMARLEGNTNGGIWIATSVTSTGLSITAPASHDNLTSPATIKGTGNAFEGKIGAITILDHTYTAIGHGDATGAVGNGNTTFAASVAYTSSFKGGTQEGVVALYSYSNADGSIAGAVLVKVLLRG